MIEKEQIQKRRQEIAEIRHADSVYRDIVARENEREDFEKRWFWELLQNAKDSVNPDQSIKVKICIEENEISFLHTGNPFELDDILSLIIQGSSKNNKEGMTGRFGTGFMTTYLLSKEVRITGKLVNNQGCFDFLLNRNATDNEHFYLLQQESNKQFDNSIRNNSYLGDDEFQTKFTYKLGTEGKKTASIGLKCLDELIPITQLFNKQLESVTVIEDGITRTFNKSLVNKHEIGSINEWMVNTLYNGKMQTSLKAYVQNDHRFDACIITTYQNETEIILPLTKNHPRLYYTFPLLGTEEIGIPIIINSTHFDPRVERDGIYLKKV
ncbi:sacsin N-terminal ATP-binding-like domain-containing protein [Sungkyunkwania multivorans]|uniref:Sacsin N-terminal ATP-binding-like domain-containing protein n=1 Tax=Sungkyunkwania multivorans TaxID=1173618 RepID=A0ABW3D1E6_9FLAO